MKTTNTLKLVLFIIIQFAFISIYAIDTDGDGVDDSIENLDGTDPNDPCDYAVSSVTLTQTGTWNIADCDGDGVTNATEVIDGTDPLDPCDYSLASVTLTQSSSFLLGDCDGDGIDNTTEQGSNPLTPIDTDGDNTPDYLDVDDDGDGILTFFEGITDTDADGIPDYLDIDDDNDGVNTYFENPDPNSDGNPDDAVDMDGDNTPDYLDVDDDGDGVLTATEIIDGTDPNDTCYYITASQTLTPNTVWLTIDCDGDGVTNGQEVTDTTDPLDPCDYMLTSQTVTPTVFCNGNTITGNIRLDTNANGCDAADFSVSNILVTTTDGTNIFSTITDVYGNYTINTNAGNFTTTIGSSFSTLTISPSSQTSSFTGTGNSDIADFCFTPNTPVNDLNITVIPLNNPIPNSTISFDIVYKNVGNANVNGNVDFNFNGALMNYTTSSETPASTTTNTLMFNFSSLLPFETRTIRVDLQLTSATVDDILVYSTNVNPTSGDATPADNNLSFIQLVNLTSLNKNSALSTDNINDILVLEGNEVEIDNANEYLHFVIRFQNTGTSTTSNIVITNLLSNQLDWNTIQIEKQSHAGEVYIFNENQISIVYNGINLPDSTSNLENSKGYIAYKIKPISSIAVGNVITNQAKIYFDLASTIQTNQTSTTIISNTANTNNYLLSNVSFYPNPAKDVINIKTSSTKIINAQVYDLLGKLLINKKDSNGITNVNVSNLDNNIYLLKIIDKEGNFRTEKIIKN